MSATTFLLALFGAVCALGWWDAVRVARAALVEGEKLQALAVAAITELADRRQEAKWQ